MKYTYSQIVQSLPMKKNSKSSLWVKLIARKISFIFTFIFINLGFSPWTVSLLSALVSLVGSLSLCINSPYFRVVGIVFINLWLILDCVDGNIARVKKQSSEMGEFIDALSGYYVTGFAYLSIGVSAFYTTSMSSIPPTWFIILGGISSVSGLLARIIHQKYTYSLLMLNDSKNKYFNNEQTYKRNNLNYLRERIDKELNISGLFMPFLIVSAIFNLYDIMTIFYLILQLGGLFIVTLYYSIKAR